MIPAIIRFSARNRVLVLLATAVAVSYGIYTLRNIPVDAIPDLSDTQVIVYSRWDRSPDIMEDQVTYPIVSGLLGAPNVKVIRGFSDFGFSYVYVIFKDGTDIYWARSRVLEYLSKIQPLLPAGVKTELGPDATGAPSWPNRAADGARVPAGGAGPSPSRPSTRASPRTRAPA
jgi:Cu(I)/Ag(I) efflux system membrane protein CusA/SilA